MAAPCASTYPVSSIPPGMRMVPCELCGCSLDLLEVQEHLLLHLEGLTGRPVEYLKRATQEGTVMEPLRPVTAGNSTHSSCVSGNVANCTDSAAAQTSSQNDVTAAPSLVCEKCGENVLLSELQAHEAKHFTVMLTCVACGDEYPVEEMYTFSCPDSHRFCRKECIGRLLDVAMEGNEGKGILLACPSPHESTKEQCLIPSTDIRQLLPSDHPFIATYQRLELEHQLESSKSYFACPTTDCGFRVEVPPEQALEPQCFTCPKCSQNSCTFCRAQPYHFRVTCEGARDARAKWLAVSTTMSKGKALKEREVQLQQYETLKKDEELKAERMMHCPKCQRVIERLEGCNDMRCGTDYDGGNAQSGCGFKFRWDQAKRYTATMPRVPQGNTLVDTILHSRTKHSEYQPCDFCRKPIVGARLECLNCPAEFNSCTACFATIDDKHDREHSFHLRL